MQEALVSIFGVVVAAFSVWLAVRIINRRDRWSKRIAAALLPAVAIYLLTFGPACWINAHTEVGNDVVWVLYRPMFWLMVGRRSAIQQALWWYAELGAPENHRLAVWANGYFWSNGGLFD